MHLLPSRRANNCITVIQLKLTTASSASCDTWLVSLASSRPSWERQAKAANAKSQAERDEKARAETKAARDRLTPLEKRLARLLASIPREVQAEGLSLTALQGQLRARGRGHSRCHAGELGAALRRAGFVRERRWRGGAEGFHALWYPKRTH